VERKRRTARVGRCVRRSKRANEIARTSKEHSALAARAASTNYKVMYSFGAHRDGNGPLASLIDVGGAFYGTTIGGGGYNCGAVYSITTKAAETSLKPSYRPVVRGQWAASLSTARGT
jgi:uncharacterized repeat protein (TIGR03803 family)